MQKGKILLIAVLLAASLSCQLLLPQQQATQAPLAETGGTQAAVATRSPAGKGRVYSHDAFEFVIPDGWKRHDEVWGQPLPANTNFYGLGVITSATIQYPSGQGKGKTFFSVASSPLAAGEQIETRFNQAYEDATPEIKDAVRQVRELNGLQGYEITYNRPWGENWWRFRDLWIEHDGVIYVLSFHSTPGAFDTYTGVLNQILESFSFNDG